MSWTAPAANGSPITGYTVTPYIGATRPDARAGQQRLGHLGHGHRADQRHRLHVHGLGHQRHRDWAGVDAVGRGDARGHDLRLRHARPRSTPATPRRSSSASSSPPTATARSPGIRFYKAVDQHRRPTSAACGRPRGTLLASATFTNETASGWQTVLFSSPVSITAGTTYVASYFDPNGHYSDTPPAFNSAVRQPAAARGRQQHSAPTASTTTAPRNSFPTNTYNANNYWVDVLFAARLVRSTCQRSQRRHSNPTLIAMHRGCCLRRSDAGGLRRSPGAARPAVVAVERPRPGPDRRRELAPQKAQRTPSLSSPDVGRASPQHKSSTASAGGTRPPAERRSASGGTSAARPQKAPHGKDRVAKAGQTQRARHSSASSDDENTVNPHLLNPCTLVSVPEARSFTGGAVAGQIEAPLGPTCIFKPTKAGSSDHTRRWRR